MRPFLLALLIALMPLRGWVGDAMATQMAAMAAVQYGATTQDAGAHADAPGAPAHVHAVSGATHGMEAVPDCAGHTVSQTASSSDSSHCQSCEVCQACHSVALLLPAMDGDVTRLPAVVPQFAAPRFTSAERALGLKPPIS